jgi:UDP-galactopyranose mutase
MVDQAMIPRPRLGFYGVIDERMDLGLLDGLATARPDWHIVLLGPVAKIEAEALPRRPNLHYLGPKPYDDLPTYLAGWDVALLPFARNESTRFISPTKTPEYLAGGKPVVSTSIRDVIHPYHDRGLVRIADTVEETVAAVEAALADDREEHQDRADALLGEMSWDRTWAAMNDLICRVTYRLEWEVAGV